MSKLSRLRWTAPVLILVAVALGQLVLVATHDLSPWSGGGFGMFSTVDAGARRHLHAFLIRPGVLREVRPPPSLEPLVERALTLPSPEHLRALAREIGGLPTPDHGEPSAVRLQVWQTRFHAETLAPESRLLRGVDLPWPLP